MSAAGDLALVGKTPVARLPTKMQNDTSPDMTSAPNAPKTRRIPTRFERAVSLRDRLARVHSRYLREIEKDAEWCEVDGVSLKMTCAAQLIDETRATLSAFIKANPEAAK